MKAIILAGGFATRLKPLTNNLPKSLLPLGRGVVIDEQIKNLFFADNVEAVCVITNNKFYNLLENWRTQSNFADKITVINNGINREKERLGAVGDLKYALDTIVAKDDVLVLGSDNLFNISFKGIINFRKHHRNHVIIAVNMVETSNMSKQPNDVVLRGDRVIKFIEKPSQPQSQYFSPLLYILPKSKLDLVSVFLSNGNYADNVGDFIAWLVNEKYPVIAYRMSGKRFDIGDPQSYKSTLATYETL